MNLKGISVIKMFPVAELLVLVANPDSCRKILENLHDFGYFSCNHESNEEAIETYCYYKYIARDWAIATNIFQSRSFRHKNFKTMEIVGKKFTR